MVTLDIGWKLVWIVPRKFDHVSTFSFTVLERVDLNLSQEDLNTPRRGEGQKTLCCLCCQSGPLTLAVSTDRGAYCAGEKILLNARLENNTNKEMRMLRGYTQTPNDVLCRGPVDDTIRILQLR